ncbi:putative calcium-binding protein CML19 [Typha angustifolia]|uniref:putative calcium-binding protein CML19 n=1 Tax=Typha angustifolia TaxID=59011 RepID=UPI003C2D2931
MMLTINNTGATQNLAASLLEQPIEAQRSCSFVNKLWVMLSPKRPEKKPQLLVTTRSNSNRRNSSSSAVDVDDVFERIFRYFDEDGDGKISPTELQSCMRRSVGEELSSEEAEDVVGSTDSDGDGLLGFEDFKRLIEVEGEEEKGNSLREAFKVYEMEGKGCITPKSLKRALSRLGDTRSIAECTTMIKRYDLNGDGVLTFDEFRVMMI